LRSEMAEVLFEVFRNHLRVRNSRFGLDLFNGRHEKTAIASRNHAFCIFELVIVEEGVIAFGPKVFLVGKVGELAAENAVVHMSVRRL